jgi:hypothetical protein
MLKNRGVTITAASQPASIAPSHQRDNLDSILPIIFYSLLTLLLLILMQKCPFSMVLLSHKIEISYADIVS